MVFRNAEISYKVLKIAEQLKKDGKSPEITIIVGHAHRGMEYWLRQSLLWGDRNAPKESPQLLK